MDFFKTIKESRSKVAKFGTTVSCKYFCTADRQDSKAGSVLILKVFVFLEGLSEYSGDPFLSFVRLDYRMPLLSGHSSAGAILL